MAPALSLTRNWPHPQESAKEEKNGNKKQTEKPNQNRKCNLQDFQNNL